MSNDEEDSIVETDSPGSDFMTGLTSIYDSRGTPVSIDITLFRMLCYREIHFWMKNNALDIIINY